MADDYQEQFDLIEAYFVNAKNVTRALQWYAEQYPNRQIPFRPPPRNVEISKRKDTSTSESEHLRDTKSGNETSANVILNHPQYLVTDTTSQPSFAPTSYDDVKMQSPSKIIEITTSLPASTYMPTNTDDHLDICVSSESNNNATFLPVSMSEPDNDDVQQVASDAVAFPERPLTAISVITNVQLHDPPETFEKNACAPFNSINTEIYTKNKTPRRACNDISNLPSTSSSTALNIPEITAHDEHFVTDTTNEITPSRKRRMKKVMKKRYIDFLSDEEQDFSAGSSDLWSSNETDSLSEEYISLKQKKKVKRVTKCDDKEAQNMIKKKEQRENKRKQLFHLS
ncbi:hypothetical protein MSG28_009072 [Choristoneura fumiferana]|uniref:Uncharacterized protein n=1 Tax=Choristoneura fumiferana TaxID=7141 RepID=A0ACC0KX23_CHOFU|nr:hypothetical protein MSG28_009072 [Choristoneura fumiferana]